MLILGIDPGFAIVGFGLVEAAGGRQRLVTCGAITTPAGEPLPARLRQIADDMDLLLEQFRPEAMAVEELFFTNNITTGIGVAQARGVILLAAERRGVPIFEYSPSQVKQAVVGYGKAEKAPGHGYDPPPAGPQRAAQAGRRRRRGGHRPLPRPFLYLPAPEPRRGPPGQRPVRGAGQVGRGSK